MKEFYIIEKFFKSLTPHSSNNPNIDRRSLLDDTASLSLKPDEELIISKDIFVENIHFKLSDKPKNIAYKLLATNLSDIASSGAKPIAYCLGFGKNNKTNEKFLKEFCQGLQLFHDKYSLTLIGGDTVNSKTIFFSITIFAIAKKKQILSRLNAKENDLIFVSETVGDAGIGLHLLSKKNNNYQDLVFRHLQPTPRIELGMSLIKEKLSKCACDISDGLLADLDKICKASQLKAEIFFEKIPFSKSAQKFLKDHPHCNPLKLLNSGDDYELIFSVNKNNHQKVLDLGKKLKLNLTCIGEFKKSKIINNCKVFLFKNNDNQSKKTKSNQNKLKLIKINKLGYEH